VILLLYIIQSTGWQRADMAAPGKPLREIVRPVQIAVNAIAGAVGEFFGYFSDNQALRQENEVLKEALATAEYWVQQMQELQAENRRLGELLDFRSSYAREFDLEVALVIGRGPDKWNQTVVLDKGSAAGIEPDMPVITLAGMVVRVVAVTPNTAEVLLIIDRQSAVGARITETRFAPGIVSGTGQDNLLEMLRIEQDVEIVPGQTVITSGYGSIFPRGLMIGVVEEVIPDASGLTSRAAIKPAVDFRRLEEVMVIKGVLESNTDGDGD
jgi:rod shape-determining protein MreC